MTLLLLLAGADGEVIVYVAQYGFDSKARPDWKSNSRASFNSEAREGFEVKTKP